ncbi:hypothetical protein E2C01_038692 [Portunus trituberculatus]|uniref:Uncharacterized protein n=1 Tax=Portunus trituberculatus TaxID=210409 RepID=A0A5B7FIM5_PORTR|nr:hypothetical protein [Portunus trituberculatus]
MRKLPRRSNLVLLTVILHPRLSEVNLKSRFKLHSKTLLTSADSCVSIQSRTYSTSLHSTPPTFMPTSSHHYKAQADFKRGNGIVRGATRVNQSYAPNDKKRGKMGNAASLGDALDPITRKIVFWIFQIFPPLMGRSTDEYSDGGNQMASLHYKIHKDHDVI